MAALVFTAALCLGTGISCLESFRALHSTRPDLVTGLRNNSGKLSGGRGAARFRTSLVTAQIALSMALLISAGSVHQSLRNISRVDLGIKIDERGDVRHLAGSLSGYDTVRAHARSTRAWNKQLAATSGCERGRRRQHDATARRQQLGRGRVRRGDSRRIPTPDAGSRFNGGGRGLFQAARRAAAVRAGFHA